MLLIVNGNCEDSLVYFAMMHGAWCAMGEERQGELDIWEREQRSMHGRCRTSDWPGWEPIIGLPPWITDPHPVYAKKLIPKALRRSVHERDGHCCLRCGAIDGLTIDHIVPESQDGPTELHNLQTLCGPCNSMKGTKTLSYL